MLTRRNAIAASVASVMVVASVAVSALAVTDDGSRADDVGELAADRSTTVTVVKDEFVDDLVYATSDTVPPTTGAATAAAPGAAPASPAAAPAAPAAPWGGDVAATASTPTPAATSGPRPTTSRATPTTTAAPRPTPTTVPAAAPTTTWPPGTELPEAWPAGVPYPPIPAGCRKPHLEDNGVWNCER